MMNIIRTDWVLPVRAEFYHSQELEDLSLSLDFDFNVVVVISALEVITEVLGSINEG